MKAFISCFMLPAMLISLQLLQPNGMKAQKLVLLILWVVTTIAYIFSKDKK